MKEESGLFQLTVIGYWFGGKPEMQNANFEGRNAEDPPASRSRGTTACREVRSQKAEVRSESIREQDVGSPRSGGR